MLPAVVGVNVITGVVSVSPSTAQVYMQSTSNFTFTYIHYMLFTLKSDPTYIHMLTVCTYCMCLYVCVYNTYVRMLNKVENTTSLIPTFLSALPIWYKALHCWLSTDVGSTDCPHLHSVELA